MRRRESRGFAPNSAQNPRLRFARGHCASQSADSGVTRTLGRFSLCCVGHCVSAKPIAFLRPNREQSRRAWEGYEKHDFVMPSERARSGEIPHFPRCAAKRNTKTPRRLAMSPYVRIVSKVHGLGPGNLRFSQASDSRGSRKCPPVIERNLSSRRRRARRRGQLEAIGFHH